jgi:hypothetical protein
LRSASSKISIGNTYQGKVYGHEEIGVEDFVAVSQQNGLCFRTGQSITLREVEFPKDQAGLSLLCPFNADVADDNERISRRIG